MKRSKRRAKHRVLLVLIIMGLLVIVGLAYIQFKPTVVKAVTLEAGTPMVGVEQFLLEKGSKGSFITDINTFDLKKPGVYEVRIRVGDKIHTSSLEVVDTLPPTASIVNQIALRYEEISAESFVTDIIDSTTVTVSYHVKPDFSIIGDQEVTIVLEDSGNNRTELKAVLTILDIKKTVLIEAGSTMNITSTDFIDDNKYSISLITDLSKLDVSKPTTHEIIINVDGKMVTSYIDVVDTTVPTANTINLEGWKGDAPFAMSFLKDIVDASTVSASYKQTPDFSLVGAQEVVIILEDESGNQSEYKAILTLKADTEAPVITGVMDKTVYIGETVSYKKGVSVIDNKDQTIEFQVDSSEVNLRKEGTYQVYYTATDLAGNKATKISKITVLVLNISKETMDQMAEEILNKIVTIGMTKEEKAFAIYKWVKGHIGYTGSSDKSDWLMEAYRGIKNAVGDCFTYFAVSQLLLTHAEIENLPVTRVGGQTRHYWSMIDCGEGWYHYDSCPNKDKMVTFMMTDEQIDDYTEKRGNNYYTYDRSAYPATPTE